MRDGAEIGLPDELGVFGEEPALVTRHRRAPYGTTRCQFALAREQIHTALLGANIWPGNLRAQQILRGDFIAGDRVVAKLKRDGLIFEKERLH